MLYHVSRSVRPSGPGDTSEYHYQHNAYRLAGLRQTSSVQTRNNVNNNYCSNPSNRTGTDSMANHHWYQPPQPTYKYVAASSSREMRNKAEKQRRDRLNAFIGELATLVPLVSRSSKRLDKTSILRLTATHLRIYQTLVQSKGTPQMKLPPRVDQFILEQLVCDQMGGFLLIMCPNGKIIFVSHTVESLLGHLQTDLMGQSLYSLMAPEDHERLRILLRSEGEIEQGWRKYLNVRLRRAGPKSETPHYESVRLMGVHRQLTASEASTSSSSSTTGGSRSLSPTPSTSSLQTSITTDILVFFVKLCRPQPLVDRLVATSKDEYVTRHLIDGKIIGCDQRIALIAGYMTEEIQGQSAFQYMHWEDVRFVMIALRQMYDRGESKGNSCYRLKSRNGQFIYLKTFGFLEIDDQGIVESFICVNVQVEEREGLHHISEMKRRYSAMFTSSLANLPYQMHSGDNHTSSMASVSIYEPRMSPSKIPTKTDRTEDPQAIEAAVNELMQNLPSPGSDDTEAQENNIPSSSQLESIPTMDIDPPSNESTESVSKLTKPHLRIKSGGNRLTSMSPDHVKRKRLNSVELECPELSPPIDAGAPSYSVAPPLSKMPKLKEEPLTPSSEDMRDQHDQAS